MVKKGVHFSMKSALGLLQYLGGGGGGQEENIYRNFSSAFLGTTNFQ